MFCDEPVREIADDRHIRRSWNLGRALMFERCPKAPNGFHCTHVEQYGISNRPSPEKCCWCGEVVSKHGPFAPSRETPFARWGSGAFSDAKCKCGAPAGSLHGCIDLHARTNAIAGESGKRGLS